MIAENENTEPEVKRKGISRNDLCPCKSGLKYKKCHISSEKMLLSKEMRSLFHILIVKLNGIAVSQKLLDEYPEDAPVEIVYDEVNEIWSFLVPKPEINLAVPKRTIITPN